MVVDPVGPVVDHRPLPDALTVATVLRGVIDRSDPSVPSAVTGTSVSAVRTGLPVRTASTARTATGAPRGEIAWADRPGSTGWTDRSALIAPSGLIVRIGSSARIGSSEQIAMKPAIVGNARPGENALTGSIGAIGLIGATVFPGPGGRWRVIAAVVRCSAVRTAHGRTPRARTPCRRRVLPRARPSSMGRRWPMTWSGAATPPWRPWRADDRSIASGARRRCAAAAVSCSCYGKPRPVACWWRK